MSARRISAFWHRWFQNQSLRSLLLAAVGGALVPVFLISFGQAFARLAHDREVVQSSLTDQVSISEEQARHVIETGQQALVRLADRLDVRQGTPKCRETLAIALVGMPFVSNLARIDPKGKILCSAHPILVTADVSDRTWWKELSSGPALSAAGPLIDRATGQPSLVLALGLVDQQGKPEGHIAFGVDLNRLEQDLNRRMLDRRAQLTLVDAKVLASDTRANDPIEVSRDSQGRTWSAATQVFVPKHLAIRYAMPDEVLYSSTFFHMATDIALPLIALLFAGAATWFAMEYWAIRPIERLRRIAKHYGAGLVPEDHVGDAFEPQELLELHEEMVAMAARVDLRDRHLIQIAKQKDALVRELHHRVKNNIQVVLSLLSLQARQLETPEQRAPLEQVQARVTALALVQRLIVESDDPAHASTIDVQLLLTDLCAQIRRSYPVQMQRIKIECDCDPMPIATDLAVPISMFVVEALTNAIIHAFPGDATGRVHVSLRVDAQELVCLQVCDTGVGWAETTSKLGTGHSLLTAFGRQLGSKLTLSPYNGGGSCVGVSFLMTSL
ncbi:sensor histidine kinase [Aquidulcibacter sp.]|uniref:sensor histidine kinase n=1 Tax=Aquidulcibacter sp. TaxID=2052990 RepID=UPI0025B9B559|nr:sensor histidine kinase [Aquidulcibacter sp.]MCA3696562.1 sensor histidine kinase [Aquidulcibacter sp.]